MKTSFAKYFSILLFLSSGLFLAGCAQNSSEDEKKATVQKKDKVNYKVTFIELGSVRCIPCQKMQPVMKSIEENYPNEVKVVFYDIWTPEGKPYADQYNIKSIPTQVFLDQNGKEYFRHEGYFPEEELVKVLNKKISEEQIISGT
jgi:thioredoxin 1